MCLPFCPCLTMFGLFAIYRHFTLVCFVISLFLLGFLLLGCGTSASAHSSVYLVLMKFNLSSTVADADSSIQLRANYFALCVTANGSTLCLPASNSTALVEATTVGTDGEDLSLGTLAKQLQEVCLPHLLVVSVVLVLLLVVVAAWQTTPCLPGKRRLGQVGAGLGAGTGLIWGLGAMLQHQAVASAVAFVETSSFGLVEVSRGGRAEAMLWTAFAFVITGFLGLLVGVVRDRPPDGKM